MVTPVLTTKLYIPPTRANLVPRPRLIQSLDAGLRIGHRLTLVSAAAGSGKTTLLSDWVSHLKEQSSYSSPEPADRQQAQIRDTQHATRDRVAWLSLDKADNDPARFWTYLIAALQTVHPQLGQSVLKTFQASPLPAAVPAPASILTPLLNEVAILPEYMLLVLDDYHVISAQAIHDGVGFLLNHQPEQLHLVIATRADPPLPLFRLRARGQLTEIRASDLRFMPDEVAAFLNEGMDLDLSADDVAALESRTEGWIVGLQLAALALQATLSHQGRADTRAFISAFTGSHHYVLEYLTEEVLRRQPEPAQQFLLQTSILDRLCGPLCEAVCGPGALPGNGDGDALLAHLHRANLFVIPLDDEGRWYRYHHLFADLLGNHLRKRMSPEQIVELHRRASFWHEEHGAAAEAVKHALVAEDFERAADLVEQNLHRMTSSGALTTLLDWVGVLPEHMIHGRPWLCIIQAWASVFAGMFEDVERLIQAAEKHLPLPHQGAGTEADYMRGNVATIRAFIADRNGDVARALALAQQAAQLLPVYDLVSRSLIPYILGRAYRASGDLARAGRAAIEMTRIGHEAGNLLTIVMGMCEQATLHKLQGQLYQAQRLYQDAQNIVTEQGELEAVSSALIDVGLGDLLYERNQLQAARRRVEPVVEELEQRAWGGSPTDLVLGYTNLARVLIAQGDGAAAAAILRQAERARLKFNDFPGFKSFIDACQVRLWLSQGDLDAATQWAQRVAATADQEGILMSGELDRITLARVRVAEGRADEALSLLTRLAKDAQASGRRGSLIRLRTLEALAYQVQHDTHQALNAVEKALSLAAPEDYVRVFLDEGQPMAQLLAFVSGAKRTYAQGLLKAFSTARPGLPTPPVGSRVPSVVGGLIEPLSERELEVLQLIGQGYSNRQIAEGLVVTLNTVKKHTSNIYGKLEVKSRTQAIARAQELGLL